MKSKTLFLLFFCFSLFLFSLKSIKSIFAQDLSSSVTDRLYTGQIKDDSGLYYYNARYYDPQLGIFTSADYAQGSNRYAYVGGNPIMRNDPSGNMMAIDADGSGTGINEKYYRFSDPIMKYSPISNYLAKTVLGEYGMMETTSDRGIPVNTFDFLSALGYRATDVERGGVYVTPEMISIAAQAYFGGGGILSSWAQNQLPTMMESSIQSKTPLIDKIAGLFRDPSANEGYADFTQLSSKLRSNQRYSGANIYTDAETGKQFAYEGYFKYQDQVFGNPSGLSPIEKASEIMERAVANGNSGMRYAFTRHNPYQLVYQGIANCGDASYAAQSYLATQGIESQITNLSGGIMPHYALVVPSEGTLIRYGGAQSSLGAVERWLRMGGSLR